LNIKTSIEPAQSHKWWIRDIIATVPEYNGYNTDISHFISAYRRIQRLIPTQEEIIVVKVLVSKLSGDVDGVYKEGIITITD